MWSLLSKSQAGAFPNGISVSAEWWNGVGGIHWTFVSLGSVTNTWFMSACIFPYNTDTKLNTFQLMGKNNYSMSECGSLRIVIDCRVDLSATACLSYATRYPHFSTGGAPVPPQRHTTRPSSNGNKYGGLMAGSRAHVGCQRPGAIHHPPRPLRGRPRSGFTLIQVLLHKSDAVKTSFKLVALGDLKLDPWRRFSGNIIFFFSGTSHASDRSDIWHGFAPGFNETGIGIFLRIPDIFS